MLRNTLTKKTRAHDLGIPLEATPEKMNSIMDVQGVSIGHAAPISGHGKLVAERGPLRSGELRKTEFDQSSYHVVGFSHTEL